MSAYEREQQNDSRLDELASKVSALRGVTVDIYDSARDQHVLDNTVRLFSSFPHPPYTPFAIPSPLAFHACAAFPPKHVNNY